MFKKNKSNKISHRFTKSVIIAFSCVFIITTGFEYYSDMKQLDVELNQKLQYSADIMSTSISDPVWDYNYDGVKIIGDSFFQDIEIAMIIVRDNVTGELYNHEVHGHAYSNSQILVMNRDIVYDGQQIGSITIGITKYYRIAAIIGTLKFRILQLLVSIITLMIIVYFISQQITKPLSLLEADVKRLAEGEERIRTKVYSDDEVGRLAHSFNDMGDIIEEASLKLHEINNSLEETVSNRTEELMQKNEELNTTLVTLKETQNQLLKTSKMKLTTRLVSGVAHEINTPLGLTITIVTYIEDKIGHLKEVMSSENDSKSDEAHKLVDEVADASNQLERNLKRVSQLMDHFRELMIENQNQSASKVNMLDQLLKIRKALIIDLMNKNIVFEIICEDDLNIRTYPAALLKIITHLTENALNHGFRDMKEGVIRLSCEVKDQELLMVFSDNGVGIASGDLNHIFTPFYKGGSSQSGSGLGLAIVENIVNVHLSGSIRCSSRVDQGTTFEIRLPIE